MQLTDLLIEVRSGSLARQGRILTRHCILSAEVPWNGVGKWTLTLPRQHPMSKYLLLPGSGLIATDQSSGFVIFSGPTDDDEESWSADDLAGTITFNGVTDETVLAERLAFPDPSNDDSMTQAFLVDERTGTPEELMHEFVDANIGPGAPSSRQDPRLTLEPAQGIAGDDVTVSARFDPLLTVNQNLATPARIGFRVRQRGSSLSFETFQPALDPTGFRLSLQNNSLASVRINRSAPKLTRAFVGGGAGANTRAVLEVSTDTSLALETSYGRRIEKFLDQRSGSTTELTTVGNQALADGGVEIISARFEPTDELADSYGVAWRLGDAVYIDGVDRTYTAPIASVKLLVNTDGVRIGATVGDASVFDPTANVQKAVEQAAARIGYLETAYEPFTLPEES